MLRRTLSTLLAALLFAAPVAPAQAQDGGHLDPLTVERLAPRREGLLDGLQLLHPFAFPAPLFSIPMARVTLSPATAGTLATLPGEMETFARGMLDTGSGGYDWIFPQVYAHVTREISAQIQSGHLLRPELTRAEIAQFYEVYVRNLHAWRTGAAEPDWARAARVSQKLARLDAQDGHPRHDRMTFAGIVLVQSMYAHIMVDLPRALLMIYYGQRPATPEARAKLLETMRHDFFAITPAFDRAVSEVLTDQWVSWEQAEQLPPFVRTLVERFGAGTAVRVMRKFAFDRFEFNAKRGLQEDTLLALPTAEDVTHLLPTPLLAVAR